MFISSDSHEWIKEKCFLFEDDKTILLKEECMIIHFKRFRDRGKYKTVDVTEQIVSFLITELSKSEIFLVLTGVLFNRNAKNSPPVAVN